MDNPRGKGFRQWQANLTPEQRKDYASRGGKGRAKKLSRPRRKAIAKLGGLRRAMIYKAKTQPIE